MDALAGRLPAETDLRTLQMSDYARLLDEVDDEAPRSHGLRLDGRFRTAEVDVEPRAEEPAGPFQNCVPVAMVHLAQAWQAAEGKPFDPDPELALDIYEKVSPFRRERIEPERVRSGELSDRRLAHNDFGTSLLGALKSWAGPQRPLAGLLPEAAAFLEIEPQNVAQMREAIWRFGGVLVGLALPRSVIADGAPKEVWSVPGYGAVYDATPGSHSSHCVAFTGYTPRGFLCRTGGRVCLASELFAGRAGYIEECYAVVSPAGAERVPGLREALAHDLTAIRDNDRDLDMPAFPQRWLGSHII